MTGPLKGVRIIEIAGIGPGPFCGMLLADHGAEVISIERPEGATTFVERRFDILNRSRRSIVANLKSDDGRQLVRDLIKTADGLIEGFRPGVMERLGLGPEVLLKDQPGLVYGRMTGWGQHGPLAQMAGHDINYIALGGVLHGLGRAGDRPTPPANLVGDFGGGGMLLAFAMVSAILHARGGGHGQVIDCAMVEGSTLLSSMAWGLWAGGRWHDERGVNFVDSGAHFYDSYETADGRYIALGAIEPKFYRTFLTLAGLDADPDFDRPWDESRWPALKERLAALFRTRTRDEWCALMDGSDVCCTPVLSMAEAPEHPHNAVRRSFMSVDGVIQPAPAPHYSATRLSEPRPPTELGADTHAILEELGYDDARIARIAEAVPPAESRGNKNASA